MSSSPIADLSYRNYDGGLESPRYRWWVIAKMTMRLAIKKKAMWVAMAASGWYYVGMIFILFIVDQLGAAGGGPGTPGAQGASSASQAFFARIVWKDQFLHGLSFGQMLFLIIALLLGAGAIANDNRANALLVYLSKPCTKTDYLFGKWFGIFLPLYLVTLIPSLVFFLYGLLSYREQGFISQDPWLFPKLMLAIPATATVHASLIVGFSSLFNQGRLAGAAYAGLYFLTNFFTQLMAIAWAVMTNGPGREEAPAALITAISRFFYGSIDGLNIGLTKAILGTNGTPYFGIPSGIDSIAAPPLIPTLLIAGLLCVGSLFLAWTRIRAVEVVG